MTLEDRLDYVIERVAVNAKRCERTANTNKWYENRLRAAGRAQAYNLVLDLLNDPVIHRFLGRDHDSNE